MRRSMPKLTAESFFNLVQQSGLVESRKLQPLMEQLQQSGVDMSDAAAVAEWLVAKGTLTQWQTNKLLQGKHKGFTLGKYRLMELLGKGGMSSVYLAEHQLMRRRCAIKVLPIKRVNDSSYLERFHREARAVASLDHPNIVRAYDIDHEMDGDREIHFLVMEHVNGQSIQDIVKDHGVLTFEQTAEYYRQAALGLDNAHNNGLVHRDVKPGNLLVDQSGVVKVLDLGLARFNEQHDESGAPLTVAHDEKVLGTADYLAPEQALDSHEVDHRADIYALGCSMYFALAGHPPFKDGTLTQRLMWHQVKEPPEISESRPEMDQSEGGRALVAIIKKLMAKQADDRYQTMADAADALMEWLQQHAGSEWQAAHASDDSPSGSDMNVAAPAPVAAPVAQAPVAAPVAPAAPIAAAAPAPAVAPAPPAPAVAPAAAAPTDGGFNAFLSQLDGGAPPAPAAPIEPAAPIVEPPLAEPAPVAEPAPPVAAPIVAEVPAAAPVAAAQDTIPEASPAPVAEAIPVAAPIADEPPEPIVEGLTGDETIDAPRVLPVGEVPEAQPLEGFDEGLLPDAGPDADEFPSLLGGTPSEGVPNLQEGQATEVSLEPTQTFIPQEPTPASDATVITPGDNSSMPPDAAPLIAPAQPVAAEAPPAAAPVVAPAAPAADAPVFPGVPAEPAPQFPATGGAAPTFPAAAPAAPTFPQVGDPAQPTFPGAPAGDAPVFPGAPVAPAAPAFPGAPVVDPGQPAFPGAPAAAPGAVQPAAAAPAATARPKKGLPIPLIAGAVIAVAAIVGGAMMFLGGDTEKGGDQQTENGGTGNGSGDPENVSPDTDGPGPSTPVTGSGGVKHPQLNLTVGPGGNYPNLKAALDDLRKSKSAYDRLSRNARIEVKVVGGDSPYGPITISADHPTGIYLKEDGTSRVTLKGNGSGPVVKLVDAEHFRMEGFDIDAAGGSVAIEVSGAVPRTILTNLKIAGYSKTGVLCRGAAGDPAANAVFKLDKLELRPGAATSTGIRMESKGVVSPARTTVQGCRIFGPQEYGIVLDGGCNAIELRETIVDQAAIGVYLTGTEASWRNFFVGNMTFYKMTAAGIGFENMPSPGGGFAGTSMSFHRNLFAEGNGPEMLIQNGFKTDDDDNKFITFMSDSGKAVDQNWTDNPIHAEVSNGEYEIILRMPNDPKRQRVDSFKFVSTDPDSSDFLAPRGGNPYANIGGARQNTKPYVGAVAPKLN